MTNIMSRVLFVSSGQASLGKARRTCRQRHHALKGMVSAMALMAAATAASAQDINDVDFNIKAQSTDTALLQLAEAAGIQITFSPAAAQKSTSPDIAGRQSVDQALRGLLEGTELDYTFATDDFVVVREKNKAGRRTGSRAGGRTLLAQLQETNRATDARSRSSADESEESGFGIEEIIVTARKREESLQSVPISISAFSAADLEARSMDELQDLANFVPNFSFFNHSSRGKSAPQAFIRGIGQNDPVVTNDPGVGIYVDGVYLARLHGLNLELLDLERIEVLRGPQGTLFGKNTNGGAVNIVTAKPGDDFSGSAKITTGRFDRIDALASVNIPLAENKLAVKLALMTSNRDGYGKRLDFFTGEKTGEMGDKGSLSGRALVGWKPADNVEVLFSIDGTRVRETGQVNSSTAFGVPTLISLLNMFVDPPVSDVFVTDSPFTNFATDANTYDVDTWGISMAIDWDLGDWSVRSITAYRELDVFYNVDLDGTPHTMLTGLDDLTQDQFSQEIQFAGTTLDDRLNWLTGFYYFNEGVVGGSIADVMVPLEALGIVISSSRFATNDVKSYAAFGQVTYSLTDRFNLTGGLRYTFEDKVASFERSQLDGTVIIPFMIAEGDWSAVSGRAGFEYRWNDNVMTYASAARGFKSGGLNGNPSKPTDFIAYDPEFVWTYEVGLRSDLLDQRLRFNASFFWTDYKNMQFTVKKVDPDTGENLEFIGNAGESRIKGFELDIVAKPTKEFTLSAAIGYIDAQYTKLDGATALEITTDTKFLNIPKWSFSVAGEYVMPFGGYGDLIARLDYVYKSEIHHDLLNNPALLQNGYGLLNGRLTFENAGSNWAVSLFATNLTDTRYLLGGRDYIASLGFASKQFAAPREWGLSLKYSF